MTQVITVQRNLTERARFAANEFRDEMARHGTLVVNLFSSPGAGKTSLLAAMAQHWQRKYATAVLVGDIATNRDAERLLPHMPAVQLTTGGACHLELPLVQSGWNALAQTPLDFLFIENVGNLVCPASFDLGEHLRAVVLSTTEGDDKPAKYPKAFSTSQAMIINKTDLLPYLPFSIEAAIGDALAIQPRLTTWPMSAQTGEGLAPWCRYLVEQREHLLRTTTDAGE